MKAYICQPGLWSREVCCFLVMTCIHFVVERLPNLAFPSTNASSSPMWTPVILPGRTWRSLKLMTEPPGIQGPQCCSFQSCWMRGKFYCMLMMMWSWCFQVNFGFYDHGRITVYLSKWEKCIFASKMAELVRRALK